MGYLEFQKQAADQLGNLSTNHIESIGKTLVEGIMNKERLSPKFEEAKKYLQEISADYAKETDMQLGNNTALTTTVVAGFVNKAFRPKLLAAGVIQPIYMDLKGNVSIKIPKGVAAASAAITNGAVTEDNDDYGSLTITPAWYGLRMTMDHELLQQANIDVIADKLEECGFAINKGVDSAIIAQIELASHKNDSTYDASGTNDNYVFSGAATDIDYADIMSAWAKSLGHDTEPDFMLVNPTNAGVIYNDTQIKAMAKLGTEMEGQIMRTITTILDMKMVISSQVTANRTFLVDSKLCGYFVDASPIMTFDGRIQNTLNKEILACKCYGVGIARPKAITSIADNTADPGTATY